MSMIETEEMNDASDSANTVPNNVTQDGIEDLEVMLRLCSQSKDILEGAKLDGSHSTCVEMMEDEHKKKGLLIDNKEQVVVIDSIDGAEHLKSNKKILA